MSDLLTKTHFVFIASSLGDTRKVAKLYALDAQATPETISRLDQIFNGLTKDIASVLSRTNPKFDLKKFIKMAQGN